MEEPKLNYNVRQTLQHVGERHIPLGVFVKLFGATKNLKIP